MSVSESIWKKAILPIKSKIADAILNLDKVGIKIVIIVNDEGRLLGTISDGDIRRGLLKGLTMKSPIESIVHHNALVVPSELNNELVFQLMVANKLQQIPIISEDHKIIGLHLWDDLTSSPERSNLMIIMAGGIGKRLLPDTQNCPKPLLKIANKPILEHIINSAKLDGFNHFILAINYLGHMIEDYFGNGDKLGVRIEYLKEEQALGTAGALSIIKTIPDEPFIVTNGDVITDIRYGELLDFHIRHNAIATMAVRSHEWRHPFGVVETNGIDIIGLEEKPTYRSHINAGVYALAPKTLKDLNFSEHIDMPQLFERLQTNENKIIAYPMYEPWLDVGRPEDLKKAKNDI
jgi:dTDP-glucose pyrophosphorylase